MAYSSCSFKPALRRNSSAAALAKDRLAAFLKDARINAEPHIVDGGDVPFIETIAAQSRDAAITCVGLRQPAQTEPPDAFGDYVRTLADGLSLLPCPIFALAAENVDFRRIFS